MNGLRIINLKPLDDEQLISKSFYNHMEKVILAKLKEFTQHDLVKVLNAFYQLGQGSGNFYEAVV